ncbi:MAG: noncanonical pyrimidine nucleotidase, YjjG family [Ruminococcaceae bacterium]|nr:noncanonical pyrimidine nucleotidase, YjjG family [Oscillospiraceae bacterium]
MIKAVLLDVDNTLLDFNLCATESIYKSAQDMKIPLPDNIISAFFEVNTELWHDIEKGVLTREELHRIRFIKVFEKANVNADGVEFEKKFVEHVKHSAVHVNGAKDLLDHLKDKYILCTASNASAYQQKNRLTKAGFIGYFKHLFISEEIGEPKPSKKFFEACFDYLAPIDKSEIIMIGDSLTADINGAHACGIKTCWYNHDKIGIPKDVCADYIVNSLDEIKNIL